MKFEDIWLVPRKISMVESRTDCDTSTVFHDRIINIPLIPSPMPDVMCDALMMTLRHWTFYWVNRWEDLDKQLYQIETYGAGASIGVDTKKDIILQLKDIKCRHFLIDTANGGAAYTLRALENLRNLCPDVYITIGNVVSAEVFESLCKQDIADSIRVFIGQGSVCATSDFTGIGYDPVDCLLEIGPIANHYNKTVIADGGIDSPADFIKALALGADVVMAGRIFAKTAQALFNNGGIYRGCACGDFSNSNYIEGYTNQLGDLGEDCNELFERYKRALQSAMSYLDSYTIPEFKERVNVQSFISGDADTAIATTKSFSPQVKSSILQTAA